MEKEKQNLKSVRLLIAVEEGDLQNVEKLLAEGADVGYVDSDHNSVLHYAVKCGDYEIVKFLLSKGADASVENGEVETPLDIAEELPDYEDIIVELQKNIMDKSFQILERFADNQEVDFQANESECQDDELRSTVSTKLLANSGSETEAMKEIRTQEAIIKSCLIYLKNLNKKSNSSVNGLTFEHVNVFMYILEAFVTKETTDFKEEIEKYFSGLVPGFDNDLQVLDDVRNRLCFSSHRKLTLLDVENVLGLNNDIKPFFEKLERYLSYFCQTLDGWKVKKVGMKFFLPMLKKVAGSEIGIADDNILKELVKLIAAAYSPEDWTEEQIQELMFELIVNIYPAFGREVKEIYNLRHKFMQEFYKYDTFEDGAKSEFVKAVTGIRSELFKYYYAKEVHVIFHKVMPKEDSKELDKKLTSAMENFEEYFKENFRGENKYQIVSQVDTANGFEYECLKPSGSRHMEDAAIKELVIQYLKYMIIFDNGKVEEGYECLQHKNDGANNLETFGTHKNLTSFQRSEIFNKFLNLDKLNKNLPSLYTIEKLKFKNELSVNYSINGDTFDEVCKKYIEDAEGPREENQHERKIIDTIFILRRFQSLYQFSDRDVISFYSKVVEERGHLDLYGISDLYKDIKIPETKMELFQNETECLYKCEFMYFTLNCIKAKVSSVKVVENILKIFYNSFHSYRVKFNNIPKAFNDATFLDNLVAMENTYRNRKSIGKKNFAYYTYMIFKKLLNIDYAAPYVARMIVEFDETIYSIEKKDLVKLTLMLLDNDSYIYHVINLMKINCHDVDDLHEILWEKIIGKNPENLRPIFKDPPCVKIIYEHLKQSLSDGSDKRVVEFQAKMTKLLNNIVYNYYLEGSLDKGLELLNIYLKEDSGQLLQLDFLEGKRLMAKIKNRKGERLMKLGQCFVSEAFEEHKSALKILCEIENSLVKSSGLSIEHNVIYLLTLSHVAYTHHLLKNYADSLKGFGKLYFAIKRYSLGLPYTSSEENIVDGFQNISNMINMKSYKDLLACSDETEEYLNILKIRMCMAFECAFQASEHDKLYQRDKALQLQEYILNVYREVYRTINEIAQPQDSVLMRKLALTYGYISRLLNCLDHKKNKEKAINYKVQSARFYSRAYLTESVKLRDHPNVIKILFYLFKVLYVLGEDKPEALPRNLRDATRARVNSLLTSLTSYPNLVGQMIQTSKYNKHLKRSLFANSE